MIKKYLDDSLRKGLDRKAGILMKEFPEVKRWNPEPKRSVQVSLIFVKEKIRKALQLGIIQKGDVKKFKAGAGIMKEIERYKL